MNTIKVNGLNDLSKKLTKINRKLKKYDGIHKFSLPFTQDQWNKMSTSQKNFYIKKAQDKFVNNMLKDIFN